LLNSLPAIQNFRLRAGGQQLELIMPAGGDELLFTLSSRAEDEAAAGEEGATDDPDAALKNVVWQWEAFEDSAGVNDVTVSNPAGYTLFFADDGTFQFQADCNVGSGSYIAASGGLTMEMGPTTLAECGEGSLYNDYLRFLSNVATYVIQDGKLYLNLIADAGNMVFGTAAPADSEVTPEAEETPSAEQPTAEPPSAEAVPGLTGVVWQWAEFQDSAELNDITVPNPANYTLQFNEDGTLNLVADCNVGSTTYTVDGSSLIINVNTIAITRAMCPEGSLDTQFLAFLNDVRTFVIMEDGRLALNLFADAGNLLFANGGPPQQ
jgi:para-nitrobenzyl esterase